MLRHSGQDRAPVLFPCWRTRAGWIQRQAGGRVRNRCELWLDANSQLSLTIFSTTPGPPKEAATKKGSRQRRQEVNPQEGSSGSRKSIEPLEAPVPFSTASQKLVEHRCRLDIPGLQLRADANIAGQLAKRDSPIGWWRRQLLGKRMLTAPLEHSSSAPSKREQETSAIKGRRFLQLS